MKANLAGNKELKKQVDKIKRELQLRHKQTPLLRSELIYLTNPIFGSSRSMKSSNFTFVLASE